MAHLARAPVYPCRGITLQQRWAAAPASNHRADTISMTPVATGRPQRRGLEERQFAFVPVWVTDIGIQLLTAKSDRRSPYERYRLSTADALPVDNGRRRKSESLWPLIRQASTGFPPTVSRLKWWYYRLGRNFHRSRKHASRPMAAGIKRDRVIAETFFHHLAQSASLPPR